MSGSIRLPARAGAPDRARAAALHGVDSPVGRHSFPLGSELRMEPSADCLELPGAVDELLVSWDGLRRDRLDDRMESDHNAADQDTTPSL